jgi:hypothetical protein
MNTVTPQSELVKKALLFVEEMRQENPGSALSLWLDAAGARFNLSPKDSEALEYIFKEAEKLSKSFNSVE